VPPASSHLSKCFESADFLSSSSICLTCMVVRRDHKWLTPGPTANCVGDANTHDQVLLGIPACQVGPGPLHCQLILQPRESPLHTEPENQASSYSWLGTRGLGALRAGSAGTQPSGCHHIPALGCGGRRGLSRTQTRLSTSGGWERIRLGTKPYLCPPPVGARVCFLL
jgi:hypothetical protein